ncbi:phospholipase D-like protein [Stackebrandtia albiflava]|uniref:Phospholipase D-like protein n=1 Tax=Stackebrandtia albiflava TaxID=406432 RepID=A0A562UQX2_9ACTN|nr:PLD nuclease N-terminal domain-containing protein [Stackebrandtia albiflava]TWJ08011.1 phospholipase D-like protein [Stackebrandtia albiflava]
MAYLASLIAAVADCLGGEHPPRRLTRGLWVLIIVLLPIGGAIAWFTAGRHRGRPAGPARPARATGPDDDPDFLNDLHRRLREDRDER